MSEHIQLEEIFKEQKSLQEQQEKLNNQINILQQENEKKEERNKKLQKNINELLKQIQSAEEQIDRAKKESSINEIKIEPMFYLKGMFREFDFTTKSLNILINGKNYYYPIEAYQCAYLPMSGSRVLVFRSNNGKELIYGFDISNIIAPAKKIKAEIKSSISLKNSLKLYTKEYGFLNVQAGEDFFDNVLVKIGDHIILNQVSIDGNYYFYMNEEKKGKNMRDEILKTFLKAKN